MLARFLLIAVLLPVMALVNPMPVIADGQGDDDIVLILRNPRIDGGYGEIHFSRADLQAMEQAEIRTGHDFTDGVATFRGPRAVDLIAMIGHAGAAHVRLSAANDYWLDVEIAELSRYDAILALEKNGKPLTRRTRGPVLLMYPIDRHVELQDPGYNNRLIWQLTLIELQ